ncbi:CGNR zinc finger domain-containing protein [Kitasatospora sp. NPDC059327]|uniref:CGNR zinc finger domain-containing protein n=1 Tax=Kitasatospora sp. NPDC059327 TaxID=3346803 RepID=UPI003698B5BB
MTDQRATGPVPLSPGDARHPFDPGALCLELLTTGGPGTPAGYELLHHPEDLTRWLARSRLELPAGVHVDAAQLTAARTLRDALRRLAAARAHGEAGAGADYAVLNRAAAHPPLVPRIDPNGAAAAPLPADGDQLVSTLARDAIALFTGPFAHRVRECGASDCSLIFVDTSRPGRRRWCSMERCGNRHKVRALRARRDRADGAEPAGQPAPDAGPPLRRGHSAHGGVSPRTDRTFTG